MNDIDFTRECVTYHCHDPKPDVVFDLKLRKNVHMFTYLTKSGRGTGNCHIRGRSFSHGSRNIRKVGRMYMVLLPVTMAPIQY